MLKTPPSWPERRERRPGDVADVDVVARLQPVAEDARLLVARERAEEDRDDAGLAVRILARPVDVAVAQRDVGRPVQAVVRAQVLLAGELRRAVGRDGLARRVLRRRPVALAVDRAAGGAEDDLGAVAAEPPRARGRCRARFTSASVDRVLDGDADVGLRGEVEDRLRADSSKRSSSGSRMSRTWSSAPRGDVLALAG